MIFLIINFFIGTCLASHALVIVDRIEHTENSNLVYGRSCCKNCKFELQLNDEIPLISFLLLKGKCRYCSFAIPKDLFAFEAIGGVSFMFIDFSIQNELLTASFLFSILIIAISDYYYQYYDIKLLFVPSILAAINFVINFKYITMTNIIAILIISSIMWYFICNHKMGSGDLIVFLLITCFFSINIANLAFFFAAILILLWYFIERNQLTSQIPIPLIPFLYLGLILTLLIK